MNNRADSDPTLTETNISAVEALLRAASVFADLPAAVITNLAKDCHLKEYGAGSVLVHADDLAHAAWLIVNDGWVKLTRDTLGGSEVVWDVLSKGAFIGLDTLTKPYKNTASATVVAPVRVLSIPHRELRNLLEQQPAFATSVIHYLTQQNFVERMEIEHLTQQTAAQRIGCFILRLLPKQQNQCSIVLQFDKSLLASRLGMRPETFSRALSRLKKETGMQFKGAQVIVPDMHRLSQYVCVTCSGMFPCAAA